MDRKTFSYMLVKQREHANVGKNELCRLTGFTFLQLQRIERAYNNYKMDLAIKYLSSLSLVLLLEREDNKTIIHSNSDIANWLKQARNGVFTQRKLAEAIESSHVIIANLERGFRLFHVDMFISLVDLLNYNIKIEKI